MNISPIKKCATICHSSNEYGEIGDGEKSKQHFNKQISCLGKVYYVNTGAQTAEFKSKRNPGKIFYLDSGVQATEGIFIPKHRNKYVKTISLYTIEEEPRRKKFCSYSACKMKPECLFTKKIKSSMQYNDFRKKPDVLLKKKKNRSTNNNVLWEEPDVLFKKKINRSMQHNDLNEKQNVLCKRKINCSVQHDLNEMSDVVCNSKINRSMQHNYLRKNLNSRSIQYKKSRTVQRKTQTVCKNDIECGDFVISEFDKKPVKCKSICRSKPSKSNKELCKICEGIQKNTQTSLTGNTVCSQNTCKYRNTTSQINVLDTASQNTKSKILMYISDVCKRDKYRYRTRKGIDTCCTLCNMHFKTSSINENLNEYEAKKFSSCIASNKKCCKPCIPCEPCVPCVPYVPCVSSVPSSYPCLISKNAIKYNSGYQNSHPCICEKCGCPKLKKSTEKSITKKSSDNYSQYSKYNYHSREGLNIGRLKACVTQILSKNNKCLIGKKNMPKSQCIFAKIIAKQKKKRKRYLKKKRLKQKKRKKKAKRRRRAKRIKRRDKREEKTNLKLFKKELKRLKEEQREVAKIDETYDTHCRADVLVGTLALTVRALKGILKLFINVITAPKNSLEYIETRVNYPKTTFGRLSRWWTVAWKRQKLRMTRSIKGSKNMTILTDEVQETSLYRAFGSKGNTKEERLMIQKESDRRRSRMSQRRKAAISCYGSLFLVTLRKAPCLWVYHIWPNLYPQFLKLLVFLKNFGNMMVFLLAVLVWTPCILCLEVCRVMLCMCLCA